MAQRNLKQILDAIGSQLDHSAHRTVVDVREDRAALVTAAYEDVNQGNDWLHLQTEVDFPVFADRTGTSTGFTVAVTNGSRQVTFSSAMDADFMTAIGGMTFMDAEDGTGTSYTVRRSTSSTVAILADTYAGSTNAALATWTVRPARYYLPVDCNRALRFIDRANGVGPLQIVDRRLGENARGLTTTDPAGTSYWMVDDDEMFDDAPGPGLSASDVTAGGTVTASSLIEVCYTFSLEGRESPPCDPVRVTTSNAANHTIRLGGMENTGAGSGIYKNVYIRVLTKGTNPETNAWYSRWLYAGQVTETTLTLDITALPDPAAARLYFGTGRKTMSPLYLPSSDYNLRLRYTKLPNRLHANADVPEWPSAYHDYLVWKVVADLGPKFGKAPKDAEDRAARLLREFKAAKLNVPDAPLRRQMRNIGGGGFRPFETNGPVSGNYSG